MLQICLKTKEITTIYKINDKSSISSGLKNKFYEPVKLLSFHNYNRDLKKFKEIIVFKSNLNNKI